MAITGTGLPRAYTAPRHNVELALRQLDTLLATALTSSPLSDPARRDSTPEFVAKLGRVIEQENFPAARRYRDFLATEYLDHAREEIGVSANPHRSACYRATIPTPTGLTLSPDSVYKIGL